MASSKAEIQQLKEQLVLDFGTVFSSPQGQRVLQQLERVTDARHKEGGIGVAKTIPICPHRSLQRDGMRSVYWYIVEACEYAQQLLNRQVTQRREEHGSSST